MTKEEGKKESVEVLKHRQKAEALEFSNYKKRLREAVEVKELQVRELEGNIAYFDAKMKWRNLQPKVEKLEAEEKAEIQQRRDEIIKAQEAAKVAEKQKNDIIVPKIGKPRSK